MIKIDKGIPLPPAIRCRGAAPKYPWHEMNVGDSFFAQGVKASSISRLAIVTGKACGRKFSTRKESDGVRVWRIE